ncbi:uncharacterized protein N7498_010080 [Penicillium cinerascens]|uniref:Rhodopsin domain-containing protein n=1 Tax=Penicillium cinerascens TaxID=70096 RepID=A0A9W9M6H9_9EURO|nr:uncharacterized protein N7498_010080 [Penicillium cinerascens]KAJ5191095.1 hypothetical protein N7498_010080 [Penicillium cinerascens]
MEANLPPSYLDESRAPTLQGVMWTMAIVPLVFVLMRLYVRVVLRRVFGWDDFIIIVAVCCLISYSAVSHVASTIGLGRHLIVVEQNPNDLINVALLCDIGESLAIMACTLGKTSFAVTLLRIVVRRWMVALLWFVIFTMNVINVLAAVFVFVQCKDPRHLWNPAIPSKCWPDSVFTNFSLFVGAYSGAQDFVLALLPWTIVWNLQMKKKEKFGVAFAMSLGVFAGAASIVKTTYLVALSAKADFTWELAPLLWWAAVEDGLAITAASIPALKPLLSRVFPSSTVSDYDMISYPSVPQDRVFDNSKGETQTDIGHTSIHDSESQTAILEPSILGKDESINLTTEVSVTVQHSP